MSCEEELIRCRNRGEKDIVKSGEKQYKGGETENGMCEMELEK